MYLGFLPSQLALAEVEGLKKLAWTGLTVHSDDLDRNNLSKYYLNILSLSYQTMELNFFISTMNILLNEYWTNEILALSKGSNYSPHRVPNSKFQIIKCSRMFEPISHSAINNQELSFKNLDIEEKTKTPKFLLFHPPAS